MQPTLTLAHFKEKMLIVAKRDTPLRGVYIPHFDQISLKISVLGPNTQTVAAIGVKLGALLHAKFHPSRCNVSPLRGEKPQNRPLSKLNSGALHFVQCCR